MEMLIGSFSVLFSFLVLAVLVHGQQNTGFISIDCGAPEGLTFIDDQTGISYSSDGNFIGTGISMNISKDFMTNNLQQPLSDLRSFPNGSKNCYTLSLAGGMGNKYLIRASFLYGNYDGKDQVPEFDLYLGVNHWYSVKFSYASEVVSTEIISVASEDLIYVCLINIGLGTPFISSLELRPVNNSIYNAESGSLVLYNRLDVGATSNQNGRYADDVYDRLWLPYIKPYWTPFNTTSTVDGSGSGYKAPSTVMRTAVRPGNGSDTLELNWNLTDPASQCSIFMYFAELEQLQGNQSRKFNISRNGSPFSGPIVPRYLYTTTISHSQPLVGNQHHISIYRTTDSTLPPILNAIEIYTVKQFSESATNSEDVDAMMNIKNAYQVNRNWVGDPCGPRNYTWEGLICSYNGSSPPRVISVNLSSSGLAGEVPVSLANLSSIQSLDLSSNSLTGPVPEFLSKLPSLSFLNLKGNRLIGPIPKVLIERSKSGSLSLSADNVNLCSSESCKEDKKIIIPIVASVTSAFVLLTILIILWRLKKGRQPEKNVSSLAPKNPQFTYAEVVSITNNFERVIGRGGFGSVYHGYLKNGTQVAVKVLSQKSSQGSKEFHTEAELLMRVHHRNLASFIGYCDEGSKMALIYEYMTNGSLNEYLSDRNENVLSWERRLQIAIDAAKGLEYLHNGCKPPIIHRDVKTANILLSEKLEAKIADFGLSRVFPSDSLTHMSTSVVGTPGYLDPEYYITRNLNEKSDVYSFGIVLLELITGQPAIIRSSSESINIIHWVSPMLESGELTNIVDPRLQGDFDINSVWKVIEVAMACTTPTSIQRASMSYVLTELKECLEIDAVPGRTRVLNENHQTESSNSIEMIPMVDLEPTTGPSTR